MLKSLEAELERVLQAVQGVSEPHVRCRTTADAIYVLVQHTYSAESSSGAIHSAIASFLQKKRSVLEELGADTNRTSACRSIFVGLYHKGCSSAYEKRKMRFRTVETACLVDAGWETGQYSSGSTSSASSLVISSSTRSSEEESQANLPPQSTDKTTDELSDHSRTHNTSTSQITTRLFSHAQGLQSFISRVSSSHVLSIVQKQFKNRWGIIRVTTASVAIAILGTGTYALTRPCVIGSCPLINTAQAINRESQQLLDAATTDTVVVAYEKLLEANYQLEKIPFWSDYYDQAQVLISQYQQEADLVSKIVGAQRRAYEATTSAQDPPYPLDTWKDIRVQWQEAIAQLESIPNNTKVTALAHLKLAEYQTYLTTVNQHIQRERDAQAKIAAAREAAQIAEERERVADSPEGWNLVYVTWQVVMQRLSDIPNDTMAYAEAQHLNVIYEAQLADSKNRNRQEQLSHNAYTQATAFADEAVQLEQDGFVTQAMVAWQNALSNIQQIPEDTLYYEQAQTLLSSYTEELDRTEQALSQLASLDNFRARLNQACSVNSVFCSYALENDEIDIFIEASYSEEIRQLVRAGVSTSQSESTSLSIATERPKLIALLQTLTAIGSDSGLPLTLYDQDRQLIATYDPEIRGYHQAGVAISQMN